MHQGTLLTGDRENLHWTGSQVPSVLGLALPEIAVWLEANPFLFAETWFLYLSTTGIVERGAV